LTLGWKKQSGDNDRQEAEDYEIIPFKRISDHGCGDLDRLRCGTIGRHFGSPRSDGTPIVALVETRQQTHFCLFLDARPPTALSLPVRLMELRHTHAGSFINHNLTCVWPLRKRDRCGSSGVLVTLIC
jgi:hypothetical protein